MTKILLVLSLILGSLGLLAANDQPNDVKTKMSFDGLNVDGQYKMDAEAVVTVENDKVLDALFGVRKNFKDRIQQDGKKY